MNFYASNPTALLCRISLAQQTKADCKYAGVQTHTRTLQDCQGSSHLSVVNCKTVATEPLRLRSLALAHPQFFVF